MLFDALDCLEVNAYKENFLHNGLSGFYTHLEPELKYSDSNINLSLYYSYCISYTEDSQERKLWLTI